MAIKHFIAALAVAAAVNGAFGDVGNMLYDTSVFNSEETAAPTLESRFDEGKVSSVKDSVFQP